MEQPTVKALWQRFHEHCVPKDAPEVQQQCTEEAFYAGAAAMMSLLNEITDKAADEDEACRFMGGIDRELKKYVVELMSGTLAQTIAAATGTQLHATVHDVTPPPPGEVH